MRYGRNHKTKKGRKVRSKLEIKVLDQLDALKVKYEYEPRKFVWWDVIHGAVCEQCGGKKVAKRRMYLPDIILGTGLVIEIKGKFTARDRKLIKAVRLANPQMDIRLLFDKDNKLSKSSKIRYSDWCKREGVPFGFHGVVPKEWLDTSKEI